MKWIEIKVIFKPGKDILLEELISNVFEKTETGGVAIERPDLEPAEGWDPGPVSKPEHYSVTGYIPADDKADSKCSIIENGINYLIKDGAYCEIVYSTINDEDWAEKWKEYFRPEKITDTIVVKPTWRDYKLEKNEKIIEIDPGMAFGTGTHATTGMCMQLLEKYFKKENSFLDIGTGSGILMIAAKLFGAGIMSGTDIDDLAIETAEKNLLLNNISSDNYTLILGNLSDSINEKYDVVAANILAEIIIDLLPDLHKVVKKEGLFICSGILEEKADMISDGLQKVGFEIIEITIRDAWAAIACKYKS